VATTTIVCNEPSNGAEDGGRTAMEKCLAKNPNINVVYTINEPAAVGANAQPSRPPTTPPRSSSPSTVAAPASVGQDGVIGATSQQYPLKMATLGMEAIAKIARGGEKPKVTEGLDFFNTGVALVTDKPADGVRQHHLRRGAEDLLGQLRTGMTTSTRMLPPSSLGGSSPRCRRLQHLLHQLPVG
jgi:fructose transport system substrate-binding protein